MREGEKERGETGLGRIGTTREVTGFAVGEEGRRIGAALVERRERGERRGRVVIEDVREEKEAGKTDGKDVNALC